jgi:hypothetical protein
MRYIALMVPVLVLAVAGCGSSSGSTAPASTGMLTPTGAEGAADAAICANVSSDGPPDASGIDQQAASPDRWRCGRHGGPITPR